MPKRTTGPVAADDFVGRSHQRVFGRPADRAAQRRYTAVLHNGGRLGVLTAMLSDPVHTGQVVASVGTGPGLDDHAFVHRAYRELLGRDADPLGLETFAEALAGGGDRTEVSLHLARSEEYRRRAVARYFPLTDLRALRPERYDTVAGESVFRARSPEDFDWLESAIIDGGYYDKPGVWGFDVDTDKRLMAELVATLAPESVLELGCATGAVLRCLGDLGISGEGVEISRAAIDAADPDVRGRIHQGNATDFDLGRGYDAVFGLDIFEHLNPNRLAGCLEGVEAHLNPGGFVFANIPAFGADPVFGEVFPLYIADWWADHDAGRHFATLHTDDLGYPANGHLIWAHTDWWVRRFEAFGLRREVGIETALHARYDAYLARVTPARRSFYVFSKQATPGACARIEAAISGSGSAVLAAAGE